MENDVVKKIDIFFQRFKHQQFKKGEILIRADDDPLGVFYLKNGIIKEYAISHKGDELVVNLFKPPAFFPMSWAINGSPNKYFFEAVTESESYRAPKDAVLTFIRNEPEVLVDLMKRVYRGTDGLLDRLVYLMAGSAYSRLIIELLIQAKRFGKERNGAYEIKISEKDLASISGMTRETVSREIKILKEKRLVVFNQHTIVIHNLKKLEDELAEGI